MLLLKTFKRRLPTIFTFSKLLGLALFSSLQFGYGQTKVLIVDNQTEKPVPYVNIWVLNTEIGTTSNQEGVFEIPDSGTHKTMVFSAVGYETLKISSASIQKSVRLSPKAIQLDEIVLRAKQDSIELKIGSYKNSKIKNHYFSGLQPNIRARYFPYQKAYDSTPFLKRLKICVPSAVDKAKFIIRLYSKNKDGGPGALIYGQNIFGYASKMFWNTRIDLSEYNILFPEEGLFIAMEWLAIPENLYEYPVGRKKNQKMQQAYAPAIGTVFSKTNDNGWIFSQGKWSKIATNKKQDFEKRHRKKYSIPAMELTLSH